MMRRAPIFELYVYFFPMTTGAAGACRQ